MKASFSAAWMLSVVAMLLLASARATTGRQMLATKTEKAPKMLPCFFYPGDNESYADQCGTNDNYTLALKRNKIGSYYGKILYDDIVTNHQCEKTLYDFTGCTVNNTNLCTWTPAGCQSNAYIRSYKVACDGSKAKKYYNCLARYITAATCNTDPDCFWNPDLAVYLDDSNQTACYSKEVQGLNGTQWDDWVVTKGPGNSDRQFYDSYWGTCDPAKAYYASRKYTTACVSAKDEKSCNDLDCEWSLPFQEGKCNPGYDRAYALRLTGAGLIHDQFMQCFSPSLSLKGAVACNNYTLV